MTNYEKVICFLLEHPPLEEIGGSITDTIDLYRNSCLTKEQAITKIKNLHARYVDKYIEQIHSNI